MQNNNNRIIIALLILVILILGYMAFLKPQSEKIDPNRPPQKEEKEPVVQPKADAKITFLKNLFVKYPQLVAIRECSYNQSTYFSVQPEGTGDAGYSIYDSNGNLVAQGGGFVPAGTQFSQEYRNISPTCTKIIYRPYNAFGDNSAEIDTYNLK